MNNNPGRGHEFPHPAQSKKWRGKNHFFQAPAGQSPLIMSI
jgi:hypothetical protein